MAESKLQSAVSLPICFRSHRSAFRAHTTTFAPNSASASAIWRPSPEPPPVTIAT